MDEKRMEFLIMCGFKEQVDRVKAGCCPTCGIKIDVAQFTNSKSRKEFDISGMCQTCQDRFFGK